MDSAKRCYLVCYDYGTGGLWGAMLARTEAEIREKYPELVIVHERPVWMTAADFEQICEEEMHDIDGPPWGILNAVMADRRRS